MADLLFAAGLLLALPVAVAADVLLLPFMLLVRGPIMGCTQLLLVALTVAVERLFDRLGWPQ